MGGQGEFRKRIQAETGTRIVDRGAKIVIIGNDADAKMVNQVLEQMLVAVRRGHIPTLADVNYILGEARHRYVDSILKPAAQPQALGVADLGHVLAQSPDVLRSDLRIKPRTRGQQAYLAAIESHEITLVTGPAGTGKTYLAMAAAVSALLNKHVDRLILTRPAVEAGENLGFLPGDLEQKVNPYLRPLYDALYSMVDLDRIQRLMDREAIEVSPLAFMRGRTLDHAFAVLDEAQNTTPEQMLMFLTRLGEGSRAVVTGDVTQIDLPKGTKSGLIEARRILRHTPAIAIINLSKTDVVRHPLVQTIVDAYEADSLSGPKGDVAHSGAGGGSP